MPSPTADGDALRRLIAASNPEDSAWGETLRPSGPDGGQPNSSSGTAEAWETEAGVLCVVCPACVFTFSAEHTSPDGGYSCPACAEGEWDAEAGRLRAEIERLLVRWQRPGMLDGTAVRDRLRRALDASPVDGGGMSGLGEQFDAIKYGTPVDGPPRSDSGTAQAWRLNEPGLTHTDAISDTGDGYHPPVKGWQVACLWCDWTGFAVKHADAVAAYREHEQEAVAADASPVMGVSRTGEAHRIYTPDLVDAVEAKWARLRSKGIVDYSDSVETRATLAVLAGAAVDAVVDSGLLVSRGPEPEPENDAAAERERIVAWLRHDPPDGCATCGLARCIERGEHVAAVNPVAGDLPVGGPEPEPENQHGGSVEIPEEMRARLAALCERTERGGFLTEREWDDINMLAFPLSDEPVSRCECGGLVYARDCPAHGWRIEHDARGSRSPVAGDLPVGGPEPENGGSETAETPGCPTCGCAYPGMHFTGAYEWEGGDLMSGGDCPFEGGETVPPRVSRGPAPTGAAFGWTSRYDKDRERTIHRHDCGDEFESTAQAEAWAILGAREEHEYDCRRREPCRGPEPENGGSE